MKKIFFCVIISLSFLSQTFLYAQTQLMPVPKEINYGKGKFILTHARIFISKDISQDEQDAITQFVAFVKIRTGILIQNTYSIDNRTPVFIFKSEHNGPFLPVPNEKAGKESREAYQLDVTSHKISVKAGSDAGIFYALETLRQLMRPEGNRSFIPAVHIEDYPTMAYRGIMFDCAHGALPTVLEIKRQIDFLARWKMNQYFFYSEVSIELKGYPLINYHSHYSQDQIKEIIAYAKERHIQIVPEIELYGHMHDLFKVEEYAGLGIVPYGHEFDPRKPGVQSLLRNWIKQYVELFPSPFFHIGFDETWETIQRSKTDTSIKPKKLYLDQLNFVTNELQKEGKKVMLWTDITSDYPDIISQFPKTVIPEIWEYSHDSVAMNNWITPILKEGFPFFIQSAVDGWQHIYPDADYTYDNIDLCLKSCRVDNAIGYCTSIWSDAVQTLLRNAWIFTAYGGIGAWQGYSPVNRSKFIDNYCNILYPAISPQMDTAFREMEQCQRYLEKCFHERHTLPHMWMDPFSESSLKNTKEHISDYKNARLAAEDAEQSLMNALSKKTRDSLFIRTLLLNSRLLDFTAMRFLWANAIVNDWDNYVNGTGVKESWIMYEYIGYSAHGLISNMLDYISALKQEYQKAWLSQNSSYRLDRMLGRFDGEFNLWYGLHLKIQYYENHFDIDQQHATFEQTFKSLLYPVQ